MIKLSENKLLSSPDPMDFTYHNKDNDNAM